LLVHRRGYQDVLKDGQDGAVVHWCEYSASSNDSISAEVTDTEFTDFMFEAFSLYVEGSDAAGQLDVSTSENAVLDGFNFDNRTNFGKKQQYGTWFELFRVISSF
jgi:hypothetical protein